MHSRLKSPLDQRSPCLHCPNRPGCLNHDKARSIGGELPSLCSKHGFRPHIRKGPADNNVTVLTVNDSSSHDTQAWPIWFTVIIYNGNSRSIVIPVESP